MSRAQKITALSSAVVVAALVALAAPAFGALGGVAAEPTPTSTPSERIVIEGWTPPAEPVAGPVTEPVEPAPAYQSCSSFEGLIPADHVEGTFNGLEPFALVDSGPRPGATGTAALDDNGRAVSYVVAEGDDLLTVSERFCTGSSRTTLIEQLNSIRRNGMYSSAGQVPAVIYAGDTLNLSPYTVASVGDEQGVVYSHTPHFILPPQR